MDLTSIDLEKLDNVDNRLIPILQEYFKKVMEKDGNGLDYKIDKLGEQLLKGELIYSVGSRDKNSPDYKEEFAEFPYELGGMYCNAGTRSTYQKFKKCVSEIVISENTLQNFHVVAHETEHYLNYKLPEIISEVMAELGAFYTEFDNETELKEYVFNEYENGYYNRIKFILAIYETTGKNLKDLIIAARNGDMEYFYSFIPKEYLESIEEFEREIFEGACINELDNSPVILLNSTVNRLKDYMLDHEELYPELENNMDFTFQNMSSIFKGYEEILERNSELDSKLFDEFLFDKNFDYQGIEEAKEKIKQKCPNYSEVDIECEIYRQMLNFFPDKYEYNTIASIYEGYKKFYDIVENSKKIIGDNDFYITNNMEYFLDEITYENGIPRKNFTFSSQNVIVIYRDKENGIVRKLINGNDVTETNNGPISVYREDIGEQEIDVIGKQVDENKWSDVTQLMMTNEFLPYKFESYLDIKKEMEKFNEALKYYIDDKNYYDMEDNKYLDYFISRERSLYWEDIEEKEFAASISYYRPTDEDLKNSVFITEEEKIDCFEIEKIIRADLEGERDK